MNAANWARCGLVAASTVLVGGCVTAPGAQRLAYYQVPCETPGAIVARPLSPEDARMAGLPAAPSTTPPQVAPPPPPGLATCIVPVTVAGAGYGRGYYPGSGGYYGGRGYYPGGGGFFGGRGFGSFGIGLGIGSHRGGGYRSHAVPRHNGGGHGGGGRRH